MRGKRVSNSRSANHQRLLLFPDYFLGSLLDGEFEAFLHLGGKRTLQHVEAHCIAIRIRECQPDKVESDKPMKALGNGMEERRQVPVCGNGLGYLEQGAILFNRGDSFWLIGRYFTHAVELSIVTRIGSS